MPCRGLEQLRGHVSRAAAAAGGEREPARLRFGQGNQLLDVLRRHGVVDDQDVRTRIKLRNRREIFHRVIRQLVQAGIDDDLRLGQDSQRVAIRRRFRDAVCRDIAGGAGNVVDQYRLSPRFGEFLAEQARDGVRRTAGRETDNEVDRFLGVIRLRGRTLRDQQRQQTQT